MNQRLTDAELDATLRPEGDSILPSSGFAESVMAAVQREVSAPPPIPFPWKRAVPGAAVTLATVVVLIVSLISAFRSGAISTATNVHWQIALAPALHRAGSAGALWPLLSIGLALACLLFFRHLNALR